MCAGKYNQDNLPSGPRSFTINAERVKQVRPGLRVYFQGLGFKQVRPEGICPEDAGVCCIASGCLVVLAAIMGDLGD